MATKPPKNKMPDVAERDAQGKIVLDLHHFTENYDHVRYAINNDGLNDHANRNIVGKDLNQGYVDCSAWVATMLNKAMEGINQESGRKIFKKADMFNVDDDDGGKDKRGNKIYADNAQKIFEKSEERSGKTLVGKEVTADKLKEGMIIAEDFNPGRGKSIKHIVIVVRNPGSEELFVSQSSPPDRNKSGEPLERGGVELVPLKKYLKDKEAQKGVTLHACDPLEDARPVMKQYGKRRAEAEHSGAGQDSNFKLAAFEQSGAAREQVQGIDGTLNHVPKPPLLSESTHPDHRLYNQTVAKLEQLGPQAFANRQQLENAAGSLVSEAKGIGMQRIDVVIQGKDGASLFAVQGNPNDPASPRIHIDKLAATERPLEQSSNTLLQDVQGQQQEHQRTQARVA